MAGLGWAVTASVSVSASDAAVTRATDWLGHAVTTRDGKDLGTVRDLAVDERSGKIVYFVVSVGSFLIENNLIAVEPDALVRTNADDGRLLLDADPDVLRKAKRFASDSHWPATADVERAAGGAMPPPAAAGEPTAAESPPTGTATIESRSKTAHLSANERTITENPKPPPPPPTPKPVTTTDPTKPRPEPITVFDHLDKDGDGVLNRSEFAHVITPKDTYSKIDANANGVIDPPEFDAYQALHATSN